MRVRLTPRATRDIRRQIDWLTDRSPSAADRASNAIFEAISRLSRYPLSGTPIAGARRETHVRFGKFGFVIRHEVFKEVIVVTDVFHGAQDRLLTVRL